MPGLHQSPHQERPCHLRQGKNSLHCSQCCGSGMFIPDPGSDFFSIPDPNCLHPGSRIRIKELKYFNPKKPKKWFLSSRKYDPGCSSRHRMLTFYPSRIRDPGSRGQKGTGSRIRILNTDCSVALLIVACCKAGTSLNLGLPPQGCFSPLSTSSMRK